MNKTCGVWKWRSSWVGKLWSVAFPRDVFCVPCCWTYTLMIFQNSKLCHTIEFADATSILVTSTNCIEINQKFNSNLHNLSKWIQTSQLVLNANNTYIVKLTTPKTLIYPLNTHNTCSSNSSHSWISQFLMLAFG
jgi:hypothetical protein